VKRKTDIWALGQNKDRTKKITKWFFAPFDLGQIARTIYPAVYCFVWKGQDFSLFHSNDSWLSLSLYQQCSSSFLSFVNCKKVTFFFDSCITFLLPWKISHTACEDHFTRWIKNRTSCVLLGSMLRWEDKHV
jgi:ABC-type sugar transport system permease subunit